MPKSKKKSKKNIINRSGKNLKIRSKKLKIKNNKKLIIKYIKMNYN